MLREKQIEEIFDGHFYGADDPVPVGCEDCEGCSACCRNTGDTIVLDPYDLYMLAKGTGKTFMDMIEHEIEIRLVDGLILPNLMKRHGDLMPDREGKKGSVGVFSVTEDRCPFLSGAGRCTIHPFRPGICRLYPMGRYYTESGFVYILQKDECIGRRKTPVRVRDWLGLDELERYETYILNWHDFKKSAQKAVDCLTDHSRISVRQYILQIFFVHPYDTDMDFYPQYAVRMDVCREALAEIL